MLESETKLVQACTYKKSSFPVHIIERNLYIKIAVKRCVKKRYLRNVSFLVGLDTVKNGEN